MKPFRIVPDASGTNVLRALVIEEVEANRTYRKRMREELKARKATFTRWFTPIMNQSMSQGQVEAYNFMFVEIMHGESNEGYHPLLICLKTTNTGETHS